MTFLVRLAGTYKERDRLAEGKMAIATLLLHNWLVDVIMLGRHLEQLTHMLIGNTQDQITGPSQDCLKDDNLK